MECISFYWSCSRASEWSLSNLIATRAGQIASLCIAYGLITTRAGQTASTSNGQISNLKVAIAIVMVWLQIGLRSDHQMCRNVPTASFWSVGYNTHPSRASYLSWPFEQHTWLLRALSLHTQVFLDPLWVCQILVLDSSDLSFMALVIR
jgi:hypothetical protein